jgi:hypothetical protein
LPTIDFMKNAKKQKKKPTADLATQYGCNARTIRNWRAEGAPLDDPQAMTVWLAGRKNIPPALGAGTRLDKPEQAAIAETDDEGKKGAGGALARLEQAELSGYRRLQSAVESGDPLQIKLARSNWITLCDQLRHFERAVSEDKRKSGGLVNRLEVEEALGFVGWVLHVSHSNMLGQIGIELVGQSDVYRIRELVEKCHSNTTVIGYGMCLADRIPQWIMDALMKHYCSAYTVRCPEFSGGSGRTRAYLNKVAAVIKKSVEEWTELTIEDSRKQ